MLRELHISNFALIDNLTVGFGNELTVLTGETGAGKSIIIEALSLVLGERADTSDIRAGKTNASVEAVFDIKRNGKLRRVLNDLGIEAVNELILRRSIDQQSGSRNFINDKPVTLKVMKRIGDELVDIHGQHEHQHLLRNDTHIDYLDSFLNLKKLRTEVRDHYLDYQKKVALRTQRRQQVKELKEREELLRFQFKEISDAQLTPGEDEQLESRQRIFENAERIIQAVDEACRILYEQDNSVFEILSTIHSRLSSFSGIDNRLKEIEAKLGTTVFEVEEISRLLSAYRNRMEYDPDEQGAIEKRLDTINRLKTKYGRTIDAVVAYGAESQKALEQLEEIETKTDSLDKEIEKVSRDLISSASKLSRERMEGKPALEDAVNKELAELGMRTSTFFVSLAPTERKDGMDFPDGKRYGVTEKGIDQVTFLIATNPGEPALELRKIVSGGELSRIMLALKSILAKLDDIYCMIFDEPDSGIGGKVAEEVGNKMKKVSRERQVITITHLHQIASKADFHIKVEKKKKDKRMITRAKLLEEEERIREIARLISGERISKTALEHARSILKSETGKTR
jgi:DNA repair protein RecN (Recombination protein N)